MTARAAQFDVVMTTAPGNGGDDSADDGAKDGRKLNKHGIVIR